MHFFTVVLYIYINQDLLIYKYHDVLKSHTTWHFISLPDRVIKRSNCLFFIYLLLHFNFNLLLFIFILDFPSSSI